MIATRMLATAFGLVMVAAAALAASAAGLIAAAVAVAAVVVSLRFRTAATVAVAAAVGAVALSEASAVLVALAGLSAACYLMLRHGGAGLAVTRATVVGALGLTAVSLLVTAIPVHLPWVSLAAPLAVFAMFVVVVRPLSRLS